MPEADAVRTDEILDSRLAEGSMGTVGSAMVRWREFCHDVLHCEPLLLTDDPGRGQKIVRWGISMADDTELAWASIKNYFWGMRNWQKLQHQADPVFGLMEWEDFCHALKVLTIVAGEPRRRLSVDALRAMLEVCDPDSFEDVNFAVFILLLYFTFSRTETPCPKSWTGQGQFDSAQHWQVCDIRIVKVKGVYLLKVRFKRTKTDNLVERAEAQGDGDWSYVGDVPDSIFSIFAWYRKLMAFYPSGRDEAAPFFLAKDRTRPYTYRCGQADLKRLLLKAGLDPEKEGTLHGARVGGNTETSKNHPRGKVIAQAHGGWKLPESQERYIHFDVVEDVASIPAYIVGAENPYLRQEVGRLSVSTRPTDDTASPSVSPVRESAEARDPAAAYRLIGPRTVRKSKATSPFAPDFGSLLRSPQSEPPVLTLPQPPVVPVAATQSVQVRPPPGWETIEMQCRKSGGRPGVRVYKMYRLTSR